MHPKMWRLQQPHPPPSLTVISSLDQEAISKSTIIPRVFSQDPAPFILALAPGYNSGFAALDVTHQISVLYRGEATTKLTRRLLLCPAPCEVFFSFLFGLKGGDCG